MCTRKATSKTPRPLAQVHQRRTREQLPWLHQPAVDYSNDPAAASPSPAAVAPLQPFRAPRRRLPTILTLHQLCRVPQLHAVRIAPALLRLCRASRRGVSPLDFSSVGRTGSRSASGHCVSRHDYSPSGLHWLYCAYVVHPDASSRRSTSRRSVALALVVSRVTASRGATTCRLDCTGSTVPMPCIRTRRLDARLLVNQSH
jgi:hypothetical protein